MADQWAKKQFVLPAFSGHLPGAANWVFPIKTCTTIPSRLLEYLRTCDAIWHYSVDDL